MTADIASSDVVQLILQYLREHQLYASLRAVQEETQVGLNCVSDVEQLRHSVEQGQWDAVLSSTLAMRLPTPLLLSLYEQVVVELLELRDVDTAKALMRSTPALSEAMRKEQPTRFLRLEHLSNKPAFDAHLAYPAGESKEGRRQALAAALAAEVVAVPPSRLLTLLGQAMKWQRLQGLAPAGSGLSLFSGLPSPTALTAASPSSLPSQQSRVIHFAPGSQCLCLAFSPDGRLLATGSSDGWLEVWDADTGKLSEQLQYQGRDELMGHDGDGIVAVGWGMDGELLGSGGRSGELRVWKVSSGVCLRKWTAAHSAGISSVQFTRDGSQLLTASHDGSIKLHGLKSGGVLKEYRGHMSFATCATFLAEQLHLLSSSADGSLRQWDVHTAECTRVTQLSASALIGVQVMTGERALVVERGERMWVVSVEGKVALEMKGVVEGAPEGGKKVEWVSGVVSAGGLWVWGLSVDGVLFGFDVKDGSEVQKLKVSKAEGIAIARHPHLNLVATAAHDSTVRIWR